MSELHPGSRVKILPGTEYYYQAPGVEGTVTALEPLPDWVNVIWDDCEATIRRNDNYPRDHLIVVGQFMIAGDFSEDEIEQALQIIGE